jgi:pimeloyl-ACP methyl ester carboxylesterase
MWFYQSSSGVGDIEAKNLQVRSGTIHYQATGAGEPVVLLHGLSGSGRWWRRNVEFLAQRFRVYMVDLIGFGHSRGQRFALGEASQVVLEWMDRLGIARANVIGHSMGGYITIELAANHAERVKKIVLVDALALPMSRSLLRNAARLVHALRYMPFNFMPVLVGDAFLAGPGTLIRAGREILQADIRDELQRIEAPAMIVWGEKDTLLPLQLGKLMKLHMPQAELCVIPGAGHNPMWDRPDEFNWTVSGFLEAL